MCREEILIIDDDPVQIRILCNILGDDFAIRFATSGKEGKELASTFPRPDLILLDINMPDMNGFQLCRELKTIEATKNIPILFVSGRIDDADQLLAFNIGAADFIPKPISPSVLKARVKTQLELVSKNKALEELAFTDGLTHIANRRGFDKRLADEIRRMMRDGKALSLMIIDVDNFKSFNDHYGHTVGDDCLKSIAQVMKKTLSRATDFVARIGGEEFAIILPDSDVEQSCLVAQNLLSNLADKNIPHCQSAQSDRVTLSIGITNQVPAKDLNYEQFFKQADQALYQVKRSSKNGYAVFSES
ncbi:diguanylate cyclase [Planctobacterium marinum]|uniref:diguanylate cyclase n=1 Tax=Planctobacterium marinum TaxID=1631968 RepID=A0AA48KP06_9ALTE|nr:diguanylate cyclase response regulator [Planctobacterium marinum]